MRTVFAALCLVLVALLAVIGASHVIELFRHELLGPELAIDRVASDQLPVADAQPDDGDAPADAPPGLNEPSPAVPERPSSNADAPPSIRAAETDATPVGGTPRVITGAGITPGPVSSSPLPREAAPPKPPKPAEPARWLTFPRVTVTETGLLDTGKRKIRLAWIAPPDPGATCRVLPDQAATQPCARLALADFRKRVRALGVECELSPDDAADPAIVPCRIGATDLAVWLLDQGWVTPTADAPDNYRQAETGARCARKGLWQDSEPPSSCPGG
ncbi:thermonuclease family protein [Kaistia dalseonensis]|uniref:Endonuclease YncB(Thermonuclease family) n=1 Tax=Kaistia dalseonensis TaxID=410840 RepID=A0ABU0HDS3_9HYPH|nr:thermonuclease family protein [Kaistia dalseonensis]MCX5497821.1 thermonuclease family protein [Kaistia dalseonensis]MDQ0440465.1 endonuclease YncB(thermonuclease family) [Kaistia dalseonensis]